jgi:hypothetical protein
MAQTTIEYGRVPRFLSSQRYHELSIFSQWKTFSVESIGWRRGWPYLRQLVEEGTPNAMPKGPLFQTAESTALSLDIGSGLSAGNAWPAER